MKEERERVTLKLHIKKTKIMASGPIASWQGEGERWKQWQISCSWALKSLQPWNQMFAARWENCDKPRQCVKKQRCYSADKGPYSQGYGPPSHHIPVWELDCKEGGVPKNWCLRTVVLEKTPESPLKSKETKPVNLVCLFVCLFRVEGLFFVVLLLLF